MTLTPPSYVIWRTPGAGFFSIIASTLARFHLASEMGAVPVVDFENHDSVYAELEPINGTRNMWEYYFEQPAGRSVSAVGAESITNDGTWPEGYRYELSGSPLYGEMWRQYVRLNTATQKYVESSRTALGVDERTLAVHCRGQEMRRAIGHHFPPTVNQVNSAISWALDNYNFDKIFLVTEAQQYVDALQKKWGQRIQVSPSFRLRRRNSYTIEPSPRPFHRYLLGQEALRDAILMATCGGLVCGRSNLSEASIMLRASGHSPLVKISQGRNSFRPYAAPFLWYAKAVLPFSMGGFGPWKPPE